MTFSQYTNENSSALFKKGITEILFAPMTGGKIFQPPHPEALAISGFGTRNLKFLWHCRSGGRAERTGVVVEDMIFVEHISIRKYRLSLQTSAPFSQPATTKPMHYINGQDVYRCFPFQL